MVNHMSMQPMHDHHKKMKEKKIKKRKEIKQIVRQKEQQKQFKEQETKQKQEINNDDVQLSQAAIEARDAFRDQNRNNYLQQQEDVMRVQQEIMMKNNIQLCGLQIKPTQEQANKIPIWIPQQNERQIMNNLAPPINYSLIQQQVQQLQQQLNKTQSKQLIEEKEEEGSEQSSNQEDDENEFVQKVEEINEFDYDPEKQEKREGEKKKKVIKNLVEIDDMEDELQKYRLIEEIKNQKSKLRNLKNLDQKEQKILLEDCKNLRTGIYYKPEKKDLNLIKVPGFTSVINKNSLEKQLNFINQNIDDQMITMEELQFPQPQKEQKQKPIYQTQDGTIFNDEVLKMFKDAGRENVVIKAGIINKNYLSQNAPTQIDKTLIQTQDNYLENLNSQDPFMKATIQMNFDLLKEQAKKLLPSPPPVQHIEPQPYQPIFIRETQQTKTVQSNVIVAESTVKKSKIDLVKNAQRFLPPQLAKRKNDNQTDNLIKPIDAPQQVIQQGQNKFKQLIQMNQKQVQPQMKSDLDKFFSEISNLK